MASWLQVLAGTLGGGISGYQQGQEQQRAIEADKAQKEQERAFREMQLDLQRRNVTMQEEAAKAAAVERARTAERQAIQDKQKDAERQASGISPTEILTPQQASLQREFGIGTQDKTLPVPVVGMRGAGLITPKIGETRRMTAAEREIADEAARQAKFMTANPNLPEAFRLALEAGAADLTGKPSIGLSGDMLMSPEQQAQRDQREVAQAAAIADAQARATARYRPAPTENFSFREITGPEGTQLLRVNPKTGESTPVVLPPGFAAGKNAPPSNESLLKISEDALQTLQRVSPDAPGFSGAVGMGFQKNIPFRGGEAIAGTPTRTFQQNFETFLSRVTLPELKYLRGLGHMSDREFKAVTAAATELSPNLDEATYRSIYREVNAALQNSIERLRTGATVRPDGTSDTLLVKMVAPDGRQLAVPAANVAEMEALGAKRVGGQ